MGDGILNDVDSKTLRHDHFHRQMRYTFHYLMSKVDVTDDSKKSPKEPIDVEVDVLVLDVVSVGSPLTVDLKKISVVVPWLRFHPWKKN